MKNNLKLIKNLATCFGLGEIPLAPGTFGTLGAIPIFLLLNYMKKIFSNMMIYNSFYFFFLIAFFGLAVYISDIAEREIFKKEDPGAIVIDEVLGLLTTLFLVNPVGIRNTFFAVTIGFVLFRIFDITKIGPIYYSQKLERGVGVVLDDFLAGVFSNVLLVLIWNIFF